MKHNGCILEFTNQRNHELMKTFRKVLAEKSFINIAEVSQIVVNSPCSRFWVSEERAMVVVSALLRGHYALDSMRPPKREMFLEIFKRVNALRQEHPDAPLFDLVFQVVNSPAPKFYMDARCAMEYIYKLKKGRSTTKHKPRKF